ncbi:hypothetical protein AOL_s00076g603 [Orbilia oligospora ATCC 24927]|uniref:Uncharacterized protein n=1 Tax=Arthrobotrys oligospora (strain ATCC 24927 / CBS 115.81 / DSM 1491) TaxID=756982 RepID=G1XAE5_ARTOA|nr:hypothetical protein AOL_s00076g603 [Orbilia oligospora ATCC 24927]EGX49962.1 hypothetical protein AOL_s00076g603 [Orbilia oligospora ATCC 24927]
MMDSVAAVVQQQSSSLSSFNSPSPLLLPERLNLENPDGITLSNTSKPFSSVSGAAAPPGTSGFTPLPSRPSVITNKMTPYNCIPRSEVKDTKRLLTRLPSIKNERRTKTSSSGSSTPDLSRSSSTTTSTTPVLSPESISDSLSSHSSSEISCYKVVARKRSMDSIASSDNSSQYSCLAKDDQYLLHLKDVEGMSCWSDIAERMCRKGYSVQQRGLRTRYCILKRDLDLSLQRSMENLVNIQSEVDEVLGSSNCPVRRLASFKNKKIGGNLRVYDEEDEAVDPRVWDDLAASLQASGLR